MTRAGLQQIFRLSYTSIRRNVESIDHQQSIQTPDSGGNSMNWVLGHLLVSRDEALRLLDEEPEWDERSKVPYRRGSDPLRADEAVSVDTLLVVLDATQTKLLTSIKAAPEDALSGELGLDLSRLAFHESYHAGQIGLLRRLLGYPGAIR